MAQAVITNRAKPVSEQTRVLRDNRARLLRRLWAEHNQDGSASYER